MILQLGIVVNSIFDTNHIMNFIGYSQYRPVNISSTVFTFIDNKFHHYTAVTKKILFMQLIVIFISPTRYELVSSLPQSDELSSLAESSHFCYICFTLC